MSAAHPHRPEDAVSERHKHLWHYLWVPYQIGRGVGLVRYCACGARQQGRVEKWGPLSKRHDAHSLIDAEFDATHTDRRTP